MSTLIIVADEDLTEVMRLVREAIKTSHGDSNDDEIEAWRNLADTACSHLGILIDEVADRMGLGAPPTRILTGAPGETEDDCTTHDHEEASDD